MTRTYSNYYFRSCYSDEREANIWKFGGGKLRGGHMRHALTSYAFYLGLFFIFCTFSFLLNRKIHLKTISLKTNFVRMKGFPPSQNVSPPQPNIIQSSSRWWNEREFQWLQQKAQVSHMLPSSTKSNWSLWRRLCFKVVSLHTLCPI